MSSAAGRTLRAAMRRRGPRAFGLIAISRWAASLVQSQSVQRQSLNLLNKSSNSGPGHGPGMGEATPYPPGALFINYHILG